jgi:hypothetical protein
LQHRPISRTISRSSGLWQIITTCRPVWPLYSHRPWPPRSLWCSRFWPSIVSIGQFSEANNSLTLAVSARLVATISVSAGQRIVIKTMFYMIVCVAVIGLVTAGAILYAFGALSEGTRRSKTVADGSIYIAILLLAIVINVAITSPALLMLQPLRLRRVLRAEKAAKTPRQRFRGMIGIFR